MEEWVKKYGKMEEWNDGYSIIPLFHYSGLK